MTTTKERAVMQRALEVLEQHVEHFDYEHFTSVCELDPAKDTILALREVLAEQAEQEHKCKDHPDAPHGFCRDESITQDRYVCECEFWEPPKVVEQEPVTLAYIDVADREKNK